MRFVLFNFIILFKINWLTCSGTKRCGVSLYGVSSPIVMTSSFVLIMWPDVTSRLTLLPVQLKHGFTCNCRNTKTCKGKKNNGCQNWVNIIWCAYMSRCRKYEFLSLKLVSVQHCDAGDPGSIPSPGKSQWRLETLGNVSVSHSLTTPRCKIGFSPMWEDRRLVLAKRCWLNWEDTHTKVGWVPRSCASPVWDVEWLLISSPWGDGSLEGILTPRLGEFSGGFLTGS